MKEGARDLPVHYDPRLIEETVFLALRGHPEAQAFHREREPLYELADPEERERAFQKVHCAWFAHLELGNPVDRAVSEQPLLVSTVRGCVVIRAPGEKEEGAELFVNPEEGPSERERRIVRFLLRPAFFLDPLALLTFLRHELLHIIDMLDPRFGYEPILPVAEGGPGHDRLLQDRYRALWDATIDGRVVRRGWAPPSLRGERLRDFACAFPMLGKETPRIFAHFFDEEPRTHAELVSFACDPGAALPGSAPHPGSRCSLCRFPTYVFEPNPLPAEVVFRIRQDFPRWRPAQGLCPQCADIYRARVLDVQQSYGCHITEEKS